MSGIAGALSTGDSGPIQRGVLRRMLTLLRHRGPDVAGVFHDGPVALGHGRLSVNDLTGGLQPLTNEDGTLWIAVDGEVFNFIELREELRAQGHWFRTDSHSEVVLHLYEEMGPGLLRRLNGQFTFALWDGRKQQLLLARDRLGSRPLFYALSEGALIFASEIKALLADPRVQRRANLGALDQFFTFGSVPAGRTLFQGIKEVPAGHQLVARRGEPRPVLREHRHHRYPCSEEAGQDEETYATGLSELLADATRLRLRADVPVGAYLSGDTGSSAVVAMARLYSTKRLKTFSVALVDKDVDERASQERMARALETEHHVVECRGQDIAEIFPEVIWHTETPILGTAPGPLFLLSALAQSHGLKVILTGEGAGEHVGQRINDTDDPFNSRAFRRRITSSLQRLLSGQTQNTLQGYETRTEIGAVLDPVLPSPDPLSQTQYLQAKSLVTPHLLSPHGDRVATAHSVEARSPFLDYRVVEFAGTIPASLRARGPNEKQVLRTAVQNMLPPEFRDLPQRSDRGPISGVLCGPDAPEYVDFLISPEAIRTAGYFNPAAIQRLLATCRADARISEADNMALVAALSTQLWHANFIESFRGTSIGQRVDIVDVSGECSLTRAVSGCHLGKLTGSTSGRRRRGRRPAWKPLGISPESPPPIMPSSDWESGSHCAACSARATRKDS